ncbi:SDR family oxidoreductase [Flavimaribacter sediminis]|uniref:SDR family oxidoreductase n=1 Tax=Flavimaribacter sediminis TaxID=2865987 RepID=UPI00215D976C|nr:SDR family oxidoreductase [Flavimaribacter sediminis]
MIEERLDGRSVVVFGGSSGVGLAVAQRASLLGGTVTIASRNRQRLAAAAAQCDGLETASVDVRDADAVAKFFTGRDPFDHVVVSAAELSTSTLRDRPLSEARAAVESKLWGAIHVAHSARIRDTGSLTLVSGMLGVRPSGAATMLSVINAGLDTLAKALATEMAPIRVNCASPGRLDTPWWDHLSDSQRHDLFSKTAAALPVKRVGTADEVAAQIIHLMLNGFLSGSVVQIDGGGSAA